MLIIDIGNCCKDALNFIIHRNSLPLCFMNSNKTDTTQVSIVYKFKIHDNFFFLCLNSNTTEISLSCV